MRRLGGLMVACVLILPSCKIGEWAGDESDPAVVVIGDSLVFWSERSNLSGSETWITDDLVAQGTRAYVTGWIGATVAYARAELWNHASRGGVTPAILVIALGTNDVRSYPPATETATTAAAAAPLIRAWLAEVPDACVRLVGVAESVTGWGLDLTGPGWNAMLTAEADLHANAAYVEWDPLPAWTKNGTDAHLTAAGRVAYRDLLVSAAASCLT